jgi:hypothetical protein
VCADERWRAGVLARRAPSAVYCLPVKVVVMKITAASLQAGMVVILLDAGHRFIAMSLMMLALGNVFGALAQALDDWERTR